jgi:hypothetical protein
MKRSFVTSVVVASSIATLVGCSSSSTPGGANAAAASVGDSAPDGALNTTLCQDDRFKVEFFAVGTGEVARITPLAPAGDRISLDQDTDFHATGAAHNRLDRPVLFMQTAGAPFAVGMSGVSEISNGFNALVYQDPNDGSTPRTVEDVQRHYGEPIDNIQCGPVTALGDQPGPGQDNSDCFAQGNLCVNSVEECGRGTVVSISCDNSGRGAVCCQL